MVMYVQGVEAQDCSRILSVGEDDLLFCESALSDDWYAVLKEDAKTRSIFMISEGVASNILKTVKSTIRRNAGMLRFIEMYDPSFDAEAELTAEAWRAIWHYSYIPNVEHVTGKVRITIGNAARHLIQYHTTAGRQRLKKTKEYRCPECRASYALEKEVLTANAAHKKTKRSVPAQPDNVVGDARYCPKCSTPVTGAVLLENLNPDRVYQSVLISMDASVNDSSGESDDRNFAEVIPDTLADTESPAEEADFIRYLTRSVPPRFQRCLDVFLNTPPEFVGWLRNQGIKRDVRYATLFHLSCEFCGLDEAGVKEAKKYIGEVVSGPQAFIVRCGDFGVDADVTQDIVIARSSLEAARCVAKEYRYRSIKRMRDDLGRIRVKKHPSFSFDSVTLNLGTVLPMAVVARRNRQESGVQNGTQR